MSDSKDPDDKDARSHIPNVFALRDPTPEFCEMIITTTARKSHVYHFTYSQICLLLEQAESAKLNWPSPSKSKGVKAKP